MSNPGKVYLVGAGPGMRDLVTMRAFWCIKNAHVIVKDRLADDSVLRFAPKNVELIDAGKSPGDHRLAQEQINELLIDRARQGKMVVRLKGGDPFVFGRGGEEAEALAEAGIGFEVVPGVSSAIAAPAYAGIPVTHRGTAASFAVITGHEADDKSDSGIKWDNISTGVDTLVFLMGVGNLPVIVENLISNGRRAETPAAVIERGTTPRQRVVTGTLADIAGKCKEAGIKAPAVTVVGEVVRLREKIAWLKPGPLHGRKVLITRPEDHAFELYEALRELGADVELCPVIKVAPAPNYDPADSAIARLAEFDWIVFTSMNGVHWFVLRLMESGRDVRAMAGVKLAAIGPATAESLQRMRLNVDFVPSKFVAESIVEEFPEDLSGKAVLIPRALEARDALVRGLEAKGARVEAVPVYETVRETGSAERLRELAAQGAMDVITFTSPSTVKHFLAILGNAPVPDSAVIACIGPITAAAARERGLSPTVIADDYTAEGLMKALVRHCGKQIT